MILVRLMGGLGNQMFQYAFGFSLAHKNKTELQLDITLLLDRDTNNEFSVFRNYELNKFNVSATFASNYQVNKFNRDPSLSIFKKIFFKIRDYLYHSNTIIQDKHSFKIEHLNIQDESCIVGRWQSERYFENVRSELKKQFEFKNKLSGKNETIARQMKSYVSVAVHVRRGDYISNKLYSSGIGALDSQYYLAALEIIKSKVSNPHFYIFSEDIEWCKKNIIEKQITFIMQEDNTNSAEFDMHLMSLCKHQIISNSTFAWWGAWLSETNNSIIIAPENWARKDEFIPPFIVPDRWIKIDNKFE